jgi:uncharacterized membrane protein
MDTNRITKPLTRAGIFLGVGLGGFLDGIALHQLLQTHNMLSARLPKTTIANMEINMFWDGMFHSFTWIMTAIGVALLFRAHRVRNIVWSGRAFVGALFLGWGLFNLIEGVIDHHILHLHHVVEARGESVFDYMFLLSGVVFIVGGWLAIKTAKAKDHAAAVVIDHDHKS